MCVRLFTVKDIILVMLPYCVTFKYNVLCYHLWAIEVSISLLHSIAAAGAYSLVSLYRKSYYFNQTLMSLTKIIE